METTTQKRVLGLYRDGSRHVVGDGFHVRNLFPSNPIGEDLSPFLLLDYAGPTRYSPTDTPRGVGEHPHRGFETVTIVYQGELEHRDSAGHSGRLRPGDVQWMTAASGVVHEEKHERAFAARGGTMQMVQLWVNLPAKDKMSKPRYQELAAAQIPRVDLPGGAGSARVIAGELRGVRGPARTFTELNVWDLELDGSTDLEIPAGHTAAVVVLEGEVSVEGSRPIRDAHMAVLSREGSAVRIEAAEASKLLVLSGVPLGEPVVSSGPFVMNTGQEIYQAMKDYQTGAMGSLAPRETVPSAFAKRAAEAERAS